MERNEVSLHEVKLFVALKAKPEWRTSKDLAAEAGIADRTSRAHLVKMVKLGLVDVAEVFPAHRYKLSEMAGKRNAAYLNRLANACEIFGVQ